MAHAPALTTPGTSRGRRLRTPLAWGAAAAAGTLALAVRDPHVPGSWGICPTALLGLDCPACGSLRAVHDLTRGEWVAAASSNLLLVLAAPVALVLWARWLVLARAGAPAALRPPVWLWWVLGAVVTVFTVLRNLPGSWLAP